VKKIAFLLLAALLTLSLCACRKQSAEPAPDPAPSVQSDPADPAPSADPPAPDPAAQEAPFAAAYGAFLSQLFLDREGILSYDWQRGMTYDNDTGRNVPAGESAAVAILDLWGDQTPELLYLTGARDPEQGFRLSAALHVYTWDGDALRALCTQDEYDVLNAGGRTHRLFRVAPDKALWMRELFSSGPETEVFTQFSAAKSGDTLTRAHIYEHTAAYDGAAESWRLDGVECTREAYESAVPSDEEQAAGLILRDDYGTGGAAALGGADGCALTWDGAVAFLRDALDAPLDLTVDEAVFFASLPGDFTFASGAGGWSTGLSIAPDGTFTAFYHDSNMGEVGEDFPNGTVYYCDFSGRFGSVSRLDDFTYSMRLLELTPALPPEQTYYEDGIRFVSSIPYGLENADEILVYFPGAQVSRLPEDFVTWVGAPNVWWPERPVLLPFFGLYNVEDAEGFFSYPAGEPVG